jgi:hypothetical protein
MKPHGCRCECDHGDPRRFDQAYDMVALAILSGRNARPTLCPIGHSHSFDSFTLIHWTGTQLPQVRLNNLDQFFRAPGTGAALTIRIDHMHPDMVLNDLGHQAVHCAARSDDQMKNVGAALFFLDRALERFDLTANAPHSVQKLGFFFDGV